MSEPYKLVDLPNELLENILSYLSYDEIAKNRLVSRKFNTACGQLLNRGFLNAERRHAAILKKVKSLLPRRESERRAHNLARHSDILTAIETRISMLKMTFMKYIDFNVCCFIPGKVIDEILRILTLVENSCSPPRTHEVLQELRDISSMAMEHFDEKIAPNFKLQRPMPYPAVPGPVLFSPPLPGLVIKDTFRKDFNTIQHRTLVQRQQISFLRNIVSKLVSKVKKQNCIINTQTVKLREQSSKLKEQDASIAELKRHVEEWDLKFADLVAELSRARDETSASASATSGNTSKPSSVPSLVNRSSTSLISPPRTYKSNIKPRMAQILPRSAIKLDMSSSYEIERKRKLPISTSILPIIPSKISRLHCLSSSRNEDDSTSDVVKNIFSSHDTFPKLSSFISSSLESLIKSPISSIKSRKRKIQ